MRKLVFSLSLFLCFNSWGQVDSFPAFKKLGFEDMFFQDGNFEKQEFLSASRTIKNVGDLPFTVHVITKEEIQRNGYVTLVDAMKTVPGVRVSQPGSSLEGEMFMMRGLIGNRYAKILINDVPIKPTGLLGMPIGAQLPIKQAERIEIIFGPAASIYGADASAGVINIITRTSERPVFVNADLAFGAESFRGLNLLLGGKMGKGKNIIRFSLFGSSTTYDDRRIIRDTMELFQASNYFRDQNELDRTRDAGLLPNFADPDRDGVPVFGQLPHTSRTFGLNLRWRNFTIFYENLYRVDHTALGFNPTAISYSNPQTRTGETLNRASLAYKLERKKWSMRTMLNLLSAAGDEFSNTNYNFNILARSLNQNSSLVAMGDMEVRDSLRGLIINNFTSGTRFKTTDSDEFRLEQLFNFYPTSNIEVTLGGQALINTYYNYDYLERPGNTFQSIPDIKTFDALSGDLSLFGQVYYTKKWLNLVVGLQAYKPGDYDWEYSPRLAAMVKLNPQWNARVFYGKAFRQPSPYYQYNTFIVQGDNFLTEDNFNLQLAPEITNSFEVGTSWRNTSGDLRFEATYFYTETQNLISFDQILIDPDQPGNRLVGVGYFNFGDTYAALQGLQASFYAKNVIPDFYFKNRLHIQYAWGEEELPGIGLIDEVRAQPAWTIQWMQEARLSRNIYIHLHHLYHSSSLSRRANSAFEVRQNPENFEMPGYYNLDAVLRVRLTDNFQVYSKFNNIFNGSYFGIDATGTTDDLLFNPQSGFWLLMGVNYEL